VLIARTAQLRQLLLADDSSAGADDAAALVARSPLLMELPVVVVSVVDVITPVVVLTPYARYGEPTVLVQERASARARVDARVSDLARPGRVVRGLVREGAPVDELLNVVRALGIDCVVLGPGATNLFDRIFVGSVARALAVDAPCSVLVSRVSEGMRPLHEASDRVVGSRI
jgi:nucleotide-binding universal stress UspA family protein